MGAVCYVCEKGTTFGNQKVERGKPKYLGGNGRKTTGISRRTFKPNLQSIRIQEGEHALKVRVCVKCMRSGEILKKVVRAPFTLPEAAAK
jgi:large subunit ribosomal protein L28